MLTMLWGLVTDAPLACVHQELVRLGAPVVLLNQRNVLSTGLRLQIGESVDATVTLGGRRIELAEVGAVYLRPHDTGGLPHLRHLPPASPLRAQAAAFDEALSTWLEVTDAFVVTRPSCAASNGSKPYQSRKAAAAGFAVPETLVTTDPAEALAFVEQHEHVVYKSVSAVRSRVRRMDARDRERLPAVARTPTQFQRYVPGTDVRVHVVGSQVFAAEVSCDADDYRYAAAQGGLAPVVQSVALPTDVAERCLRLCQDLNLPVAGIDLRRTPEDIWVCFEVNPSPAFTYYAQRTAQPIGAAIAARLAAAAYVASSRSKPPQRAAFRARRSIATISTAEDTSPAIATRTPAAIPAVRPASPPSLAVSSTANAPKATVRESPMARQPSPAPACHTAGPRALRPT